MLLLPKQRVRRYQITLIAVLVTALSSMFLIISFQSTIQDIRKASPSVFAENQEASIFADSPAILDVIEFGSLVIFLLGLLGVIEILFFWMPSLIDLTESKGKMIWLTKGVISPPERVFSLLEEKTRVIIRRKKSSFGGLCMREFIMETYLPIENSNIKQIIDFSGMERVIKTSTHNILVKTVKIEHLPLQIIQIRSLLALMKLSPSKTLSSK